MLIAKIENNLVVDLLDTDTPSNFKNYIEVPEWISLGSDIRYFDESNGYNPKPTTQLIEENLITHHKGESGTFDEAPLSLEDKARAERNRLLVELDAMVSNPFRFAEYSDAKKKAKDIETSTKKLVDYAVEKGTPVLEDAANAIRLKAIDVTKEVLEKLESKEK